MDDIANTMDAHQQDHHDHNIDHGMESESSHVGSHHMATEAVLDITLGEQGARTLLRHFRNVETLYVRYTASNEDGAHPLGNRGYSVSTETIVAMFEVLASHAGLRRIVVDKLEDMEGDARCHCRFPLKGLTVFLEKATQLTSIELDLDTTLDGTEEDGAAFLRALRDHVNLKNLEIGDFSNDTSTISASRFSPLSVPKWEELSISHAENQITKHQVEQNLKSPVLKKLLIDTNNGQFQAHMPKIFETLQKNACNLVELNMLDELTEETTKACVEMVRHNTTLENLLLSLGIQSRYGTSITKALLDNRTITSLRLIMSGERNGDAKALIGHLEQNRVLKRVHFHFQGIFDHDRVKQVFMEPLADILERNCFLEELCMDKCHGTFELTPEIEFYLSLNKAGRKNLMGTPRQSATRILWVDTVIQNRYDVNIVYYFLSLSPALLPPH